MPPNIPRYKHYLSYLFELSLTRTSSAYNPYLEVLLSRGRTRLNTKVATYSFEDLYRNYNNAFTKLNIRQQRLDKVLLLGLGLGSVPMMLETKFGQSASYTAVEIDEVIIRLAQQYLPDSVKAALTVHCADAHTFVQTDGGSYDLIAMDIFIDLDTPSEFRSDEFVGILKKLLKRGGYLLYNTLTLTDALKTQSEAFFNQIFKKHFPDAMTFQTAGNLMLVAKML